LKEKYNLDIIYFAVWYIPKYKKLYEELEKIWYAMIYNKVTILSDGSTKWNVDIDIAIKSVYEFCNQKLTKAYLITNDWDYNSLIEFFVSNNIRWKLITPDSKSASKNIKSISGWILDLQDIKSKIQKKLAHIEQVNDWCTNSISLSTHQSLLTN